MVSPERIQQLADRIGSLFRPDRVILFGSYAYGQPTETSDVDFLVVMPFEGRERVKAIEVKRAIGVDFSMDVLVYNPENLRQRLAWGDFFLREITQKGRTLYESANAGVG